MPSALVAFVTQSAALGYTCLVPLLASEEQRICTRTEKLLGTSDRYLILIRRNS
jgi:hypothetical protein